MQQQDSQSGAPERFRCVTISASQKGNEHTLDALDQKLRVLSGNVRLDRARIASGRDLAFDQFTCFDKTGQSVSVAGVRNCSFLRAAQERRPGTPDYLLFLVGAGQVEFGIGPETFDLVAGGMVLAEPRHGFSLQCGADQTARIAAIGLSGAGGNDAHLSQLAGQTGVLEQTQFGPMLNAAMLGMVAIPEFNERNCRPFFEFFNNILRMIAEDIAASGETGTSATTPSLRAAASLIAKNYTDPDLSQTEVARRLNMSERSLRRVFAEEGTSFKELLTRVRIERARQTLASSDLSIEQVATASGFARSVSFYRNFKRFTGTTPSAYRAAARAGDLDGKDTGV